MFFRRKSHKPCECPSCEERIKRLHEEVVFLSRMLDRSLEKLQSFSQEIGGTFSALEGRLDKLAEDVKGFKRYDGPHWDRGDQIDG